MSMASPYNYWMIRQYDIHAFWNAKPVHVYLTYWCYQIVDYSGSWCAQIFMQFSPQRVTGSTVLQLVGGGKNCYMEPSHNPTEARQCCMKNINRVTPPEEYGVFKSDAEALFWLDRYPNRHLNIPVDITKNVSNVNTAKVLSTAIASSTVSKINIDDPYIIYDPYFTYAKKKIWAYGTLELCKKDLTLYYALTKCPKWVLDQLEYSKSRTIVIAEPPVPLLYETE